MKRVMFQLTACLVVSLASHAAEISSQATIERFVDTAVKVTGQYAAVRLPIKNGPPLWNPSRITITPKGLVFVANYTGEILTLHDSDGDGLEDTTRLFVDTALKGKPADVPRQAPGLVASGPALRYPTAMTYKDGWLYVGTTQAIHRFRVDVNGKCIATELFASGWPYTMHPFDWTFGMRFGKDGWLYAILCTDYLNSAAAPDPLGLRGSMIRISPDGKKIERFACGLRYAYGLAINDAGDVFFTDNHGGEQNVTEELNHAVLGGNYGHLPKNPTALVSKPILDIQTDASPNGCAFNPLSNKHFGNTAGDLFIACWGNDGQWENGGIARARLSKRPDGGYDAVEETFSQGPPKVIDLDFAPSGDMYVARFGREASGHAPTPDPDGDIYRFIHAPWIAVQNTIVNPLLTLPGDPEKGKALFTSRACSTCHSLDRSASLLGPDLKDISLTMDRHGLLESIVEPAKNIKTDYDTTLVTKKNGEQLIGCVAMSDEEKLLLKMPGGVKLSVPKSEIAKVEIQSGSLMPPGLLTGASEDDKNNLFSYLESLAIERVLRVNAGGGAAKIGDVTYQADVLYQPGSYGFLSGQTAAGDRNQEDTTLRSCRYGNVAYRFDCNHGDYDVTLTFAENWFSDPGQRVFSILVNGKVVIADLDIAKEVSIGQPLKKKFRVTANQGMIHLSTNSKINNAMISSIEIKAVRP